MGFNPKIDRQDEINLVEYVIQHLKDKISELESSLSFMLELKSNMEEKLNKNETIGLKEAKSVK